MDELAQEKREYFVPNQGKRDAFDHGYRHGYRNGGRIEVERWRPVLEKLVQALDNSSKCCDDVWNFIIYGKSGDIVAEIRELLKETE